MTRNRRNSMLSFRKSSSGSVPKVEATETPKEKAAFHINTKADPTKAINEAEPAVRNAGEATTIQSLRHMEHRDAEGNIITDPDRSNPTRPRMERPLDTIRSFEAAIDGSYSRRASYKGAFADSSNPSNVQNNRRSGYFSGYQSQRRSQIDGGGYYGNHNNNSSSRPDSYIENHNTPPHHFGNSSSNGNSRRFGPRNHSDPALYGHASGQAVYPSHGHQQSYDTVASASNGSHATDQWGNSTDPSSENSSIDKVQTVSKPDAAESYGFNGFGGAPQFQGPILEEHGQGAPAYGQPGYGKEKFATGQGNPYQGSSAPAPPPHAPLKEQAPRVPIQLGGFSAGNAPPAVSARPPPPVDMEKRKSWLKRRFSRG